MEKSYCHEKLLPARIQVQWQRNELTVFHLWGLGEYSDAAGCRRCSFSNLRLWKRIFSFASGDKEILLIFQNVLSIPQADIPDNVNKKILITFCI